MAALTTANEGSLLRTDKMINTKREQIEQLADELSIENQYLLIQRLTHLLIKTPENGASDSQSQDDEIQKILDAAWGALGSGKTPDELDRELNKIREWDWSRDWNREP